MPHIVQSVDGEKRHCARQPPGNDEEANNRVGWLQTPWRFSPSTL